MYNKNKLGSAIKLALVLSTASVAATSTNALAADGSAKEVERIEVTGSRIKRVDVEGPSPVQVYDKTYLESMGSQTVADFLSQSSFAGFNMTTENTTLGQGAGSANFDARGFGTSYTVFLINGRRMPGSPQGGNGAADINQIPMAAVERIEFLADGASAIYGADAISGVINIITKSDFEGGSVKAQYGMNIEHQDGNKTSFEIVTGSSTDTSSTMLAFDYFKQDVVWAKDRPLINSAISPVTGEDSRSPTGLPGTWWDLDWMNPIPVEGCPEDRKVARDGGFVCAYDFAELYQAIPESERFNIFASHKQEFSDNVNGFLEVRHSRAATKVRNGAAPAYFFVSADAEENPFGEDVNMARRLIDAGPRQRDGVNTTTNIAVGLDYDLNDDHMLSGYYTKSWANNNQTGMGGNVSEERLSAAVDAGLISLIDENDPSLWTLEPHKAENGEDYWIAIPIHRQGELTEEVVNLGLSGNFDLLENFGYAIGVENRKEQYFDYTDIAQIEDDIAGGAASYGKGDREFKSVFAEVVMNPIEALEISTALRWDDISTSVSDIGSKTTYKIAMSYRVNDDMLLRASHATGFKAPTLGDLFLGESFGVNNAIDTKACEQGLPGGCDSRDVNVKQGGNKELKPEESTSYNFGMSFELVEDLSITADYWNIEVDGMISSLTAQQVINNEDQYPELVNRIDGRLTHPDSYVATNLQNLNSQEGSGVDLDVSYKFDAAGGMVKLGINSSYLISMKRQSSALDPLCEDAGTSSEPEWRHNFRASWDKSDYGVNLSGRYIGETTGDRAGRAAGSCESLDPTQMEEVDSYVQFDAQGYYHFENGTRVTLGIRNLFDEEPSYSETANPGWPYYDRALYSNMGREMYMSFSHKF